MMPRSSSWVWVWFAALTLSGTVSGMYCPEAGRFLQQDPIGYEDGLNLYQYASSNPLIQLDAYGLFWAVLRNGGTTAEATVWMVPRTISELAYLIGLDSTDFRKWLTLENGITLAG